MPRNLIFRGIDLLIATLYVNSYLALLNAPYYIQPNDTEAVEISEFRAHRPSLHNRELEAERLEESRKNVFKHPCDHDDTLHATCLVRVAMKLVAAIAEISPQRDRVTLTQDVGLPKVP
ncbi:hypothetical protein AZE42_05629 [Rhizopogon vesiculosus]|uniref:Uncharacterized protein n=1 Tax=Rhizopogon vesiculosus TaxID=180088 RepID=A0A1J8R2C2_9AGAM|nr:hypothetical protein AZE42_05629 [Rhizopogon vesiculosus]